MTAKTLILIDGHALAYRQFFALERTRMKTTDNVNTWAVYGFMKAIFDLLKKVKPDAIAVSFDKGRETFRLKEYSEYKANRQEMPDSLRDQMKLIVEAVNTLEIPIYQKENYEADDVIGTIARKATELGHNTLILTGDQDSFQLIDANNKVKVLIPSKGELVEFNRDKVHEKLGVWPEQVVDYKGLRGDTSDNIPGVKGIGEKTAVKLLSEYENIDNIYDHIEEISSKSIKSKLEADKEKAYLSKFLAQICLDVPIDFDFEHTHVSMPDVDKLADFLRKLQFHTFLKQLPDILSHCCEGEVPDLKFLLNKPEHPAQKQQGQLSLLAGPSADSITMNKNYEVDTQIIDNKEDFIKFIETIKTQEVFSFDTETTSTNALIAELVGMSFGWNEQIKKEHNKISVDKTKTDKTYTAYIPLGHKTGTQLDKNYIIEELKPILESKEKGKVLQNAKYEINVLKKAGIELKGIIMDTMLASYIKNPAYKHNLKQQAFSYLGYEMTEIDELIGKGKSQITMDFVDIEKAADYACGDAKSTLELAAYYCEHLSETDTNLLYTIEMPLIPVLADMERTGVSIDLPYLEDISKDLEYRIDKIEEKIYEYAEEKFNINSPKQVGDILFEKLQLPTRGKVKTKTGYSTSAKVLESLKDEHPIIPLLLAHRHFAKLKSTYIDALPKLVNNETGRIHTSFNQAVTTTGRLSSSDPNLQNIPIRSEIGNKIRGAFVPADKEKYSILAADYSQIELRLLAHACQDEGLLDAFNKNKDIHTDTASKIFNVALEDVTSDMRRTAKAVNFGLIYGQTTFGLSEFLGISPAEAKEIITKYFTVYPKIKSHMDYVLKTVHKTGYAETLYNRKRYLKDDLNSRIKAIRENAERAAFNASLQGTAADLIKLAMVKLHEKLDSSNYKSKLILQVHDELVLEVPNEEIEEIKQVVKESMELDQPLTVPLVIDISCGPSWMESKE